MTAPRRLKPTAEALAYRTQLHALLRAMNETLDPAVVGEVLRAASEWAREKGAK